MSFARFCRYFFAQFAQIRKYFLRKLRMKRNFSFAQLFLRNLRKTASFTQNVTFRQIVKIDILSLELNN